MNSPPPSRQVIAAVASQEGQPSGALSPPLYDAIDPEALDGLFRDAGVHRTSSVEISFQYLGYDVHVDGTDRTDVSVSVTAPPTGERDASLEQDAASNG